MKKSVKILLNTFAGISTIALSSGLVFSLTAISPKSNVVNVDFNTNKNKIDYSSLPDASKWLAHESVYVTNKSNHFFGSNLVDSNPSFATDKSIKKGYVAEIIDGSTHQIFDQSFNQSVFEGIWNWVNIDNWSESSNWTTIDKTNENDATAYKPSNDKTEGFLQTYKTLIENNYRTLVACGFLHQAAIEAVVQDIGNETLNSSSPYKDSGFIFIDGEISNYATHKEGAKHVASVQFRADQATFLAALESASYLLANFDIYGSQGLKVGTFGGQAIPSVTSYMGGFQNGIYFYNTIVVPKIMQILQSQASYPEFCTTFKKLVDDYNNTNDKSNYANKISIGFVSLGSKESYFTNSFNAGDAKIMSQILLAKGAQVILPVAGPQTSDVVNEIYNSKSNAIVIGVDTAQELDGTVNKKWQNSTKDINGNNDIIKFSAVKNLGKITASITNNIANGKAYSTQIDKSVIDETIDPSATYSLGYETIGTLTNDGVGITNASKGENGQDNLITSSLIQLMKDATGSSSITSLNTLITYLLSNDDQFQTNSKNSIINVYVNSENAKGFKY